ncbi:hypothetical protein AJ80_04626 [Polytolypa hystricis UAMH7299]|uniref:Pleckstrin homology domain-containing protein n=1 Tax=Polytolypa hystricis (strain UAMH7299) TaxID=1447883 RepID=A0A2B7Y9S8_POLH7|nr:hypothetical protein AJ80_04626 [Polytolypa hystricis UAMH7299]
MPSDWETEHVYLAQALPTPTDTPYRTPNGSMSRLSLHRRGSSPGPSSSPPPNNRSENHARGDMMDLANDETISPLDPRRFTPTLHASLVSEILSLRRELESKTRIIDTLEISLDNTKEEAETLNESLSKNTKENRSLKRQLQLLEGGSNSAMSELSRERDEALENISDFRKRLEQSQKKIRSQEDEMERTQMLWDRDRQKWDEERRNLERKVHVVEGRLKVVLNEVAAVQAANSFDQQQDLDDDDFQDSAVVRGSDTTSIRSVSVIGRRRMSGASVSTHDGDPHGYRYSMMSMVNGHGQKFDGLNLADELAFDEEEEDNVDTEDERPESRATIPENKRVSKQSQLMGIRDRKVLRQLYEGREGADTPDGPEQVRNMHAASDFREDGQSQPAPRLYEYRDRGVQYTPPPSPKLAPEVDASSDVEPEGDTTIIPTEETEIVESNRMSVDRDTPIYQSADSSTATEPVGMLSSACQTTTELPSPPQSPTLEEVTEDVPSIPSEPSIETHSSSTQTDEVVIIDKDEAKLADIARQFQPPPIPVIAVHPPASNPPSPRDSVVLPPQTKSISCQTDIPTMAETHSTGMQTEEIRVDKRAARIKTTLLPSAILDQPGSPEFTDLSSPPPLPPYYAPPPKSARRKLRNPPPVDAPPPPRANEKETYQAYPGNNDNGPLAEDANLDIRRPFRSSSLFAGFENSDDEWPEPPEDRFIDDDMFNRPMVSYTIKSGKMVSKYDDDSIDGHEEQHSPKSIIAEEDTMPSLPGGSLQRSLARGRSSAGKRPAVRSKQPDIRRAAMISSSTAAHQSFRPRSPSAPSIGSVVSSNTSQPPFPVPVRLSSRKIGPSASEGAQSPTPYSNGEFSGRSMGRQREQEPPLRKVRSDAAVIRTGRHARQRSRSPPALSTSSTAPDSPQLPPMPYDEITAPRARNVSNPRSNRPPPSRTVSHSHSRQESTATSVQQTSVVDAIAQTMVGEWMWKYVRRRKSFGMPDNSKDTWEGKSTEEVSANITGTGVRHRRWVWLAPYERAVMWSSKQPTSGSALLGKSGRKLLIQSVLDVKDDNPLPKGAAPQNQFNRSILILTPQRALKFTALTVERHYVWLTALSFLSHSSMDVNDLASLPPVPSDEFPPPPPTASLRRNPIRDSIRVAKGKAHAARNRTAVARPTVVPELPVDEVDPADPMEDAADPPNVPRFSSHARKRSNTAPRVPPATFRSFSNHAPMPSTYSTTTAGSSDIHSPISIGQPGVQSGQSSISYRTSEASGPSTVGMSNFFDAVGTVRMEAFVDRQDVPRRRGTRSRRTNTRNKEPNYWAGSPDIEYPKSDDGGSGDIFFRHDDPFRGF